MKEASRDNGGEKATNKHRQRSLLG